MRLFADLATEREPELDEPFLRGCQALLVLVGSEPCRQVDVVQSSHASSTIGAERSSVMNLSRMHVDRYRERCMFVKICGITNEDDALLAVAMGADAVGFIFVQGSTRQIAAQVAYDITRRLPAEILTVGIFRNEHPSRGGRRRSQGRRQGGPAARTRNRCRHTIRLRRRSDGSSRRSGPMIPTSRERTSTAPT